MRVTNSVMMNDLLRNLNNNAQHMDEIQRQIASGKRINSPSDDPAGLVKSLRLRTNLTEGQQYLDNINEAVSYMDTTDSALNSMSDLVQKIRELTVQAATGTNNQEANQAIAQQIANLTDQLKIVANTTYGTKNIFAGTNVTENPYQDGEWTGNRNDLEVEIGSGVKIKININQMQDFLMGRLNDLQIDTAASGITQVQAKNLQEGAYSLKTEIGSVPQSSAFETQSYLSSISNNGKFFYQDESTAATLGAGKAPTAPATTLANDAAYNGSLLIETTKVTPGEPKYTFSSNSGNITFKQNIYCKDESGNLAAVASGVDDFKSRFNYTGSGQLGNVQYSTDSSGTATIDFSTQGAVDGDTIVWNDDQGGTTGSGVGKAYDKDGNDYPAITFKFNGSTSKWEYDGPSVHGQVTANIKGHVYSSTGEYKEVNLSNVKLDMETGAGGELFRIKASDFSDPNFTDDLVIWNAGSAALGGINPNSPEIKVGDKAVISFSGQAVDPASQKIDIAYQYTDLNGKQTGQGSHSMVFQDGTFQNNTRDIKFFTLNQQTGLSYSGAISQRTGTFAADDTAASFNYEAGLFSYMEDLTRKVEVGKLPQVGNELAGADTRLNELLLHRATIGARINRLELQQGRLEDTQISLTGLLSKAEDVDEAKVIMELKTQENVYNASLAVGAKIIQPTLMDFLR